MDAVAHWDRVHATARPDAVSWFQDVPEVSLRLIERFAPARASVLDIGGATSPLVRVLAARGFGDLTVLDVSQAALDRLVELLGDDAATVTTICADVRDWAPDRCFDVWHDRACLHFLMDPSDRARYAELAARATAPGAVAIIAAFAQDGPTSCSGLPTQRYDAAALAATLGGAFELVHDEREEHRTPAGVVQPFVWAVLVRR